MAKPPCCEKNGVKKGPWTTEEDQKLLDYIQKHGHGRWRTLPKNAGLKRCGKSCRLRWTNYLRPDIKRGRFSFEEEETIIQLHGVLGNKWSAIAAQLPGRTDNEIKNYWNTHIKKRLLRMGIDPVTHTPRLDLLDLSSILSSSLYTTNSQFHPSSLLGMGSPMNQNLLNLATTFLSCQPKNPEISAQNLQENQLGNTQLVQNQFPPFQTCQLQSPVSDSNAQYQNDHTQLNMQANLEQYFPRNPSNLSCQNSLPNLWQQNVVPKSFTTIPKYGYHDSNVSFINHPLSKNQTFLSNNGGNIQNLSFGQLLSSTPSSSSTPLHSSSTTTYVNGSTEDEKDSYCSNMLMFDIPSDFNVKGCL